ncbi:M23 family metallopeptidase [Oceanobacillus sp. FSL H7-0719]|uniref:M23 family metallopeptidase n=1 Tax=Oceanobacillus sp. FSL H7-0719 TaxID=2954507 RepID=UPI00325598F3
MKKLIMGISFIALLVIGLVACSEKEDASSTQSEEDDSSGISDDEVEEEQTGTDSGRTSEEIVTVESFGEVLLDGNYKQIYQQTSQAFQTNVTFEQFENLASEFNQDVGSFELVSEMPLLGMMEYQWVSDTGDKGIRSYWAEDETIEGLQLMPISSYPESDAEYTKNTYRMPINEEWFTFWGGTNELINYHYAVESQRYAYDLLIFEEDNSFNGEATDNDSYYAFGKDVVAPLEGTVVSVENNIADNTPTVDTNAEEPLGNHVIIEHENGEYSVLAHFKQGSVVVSKGEEVKAGQLLGAAGNSGNSSEAHIHFHVADHVKWEEARSIRIKFENGAEPRRGEITSGF